MLNDVLQGIGQDALAMMENALRSLHRVLAGAAHSNDVTLTDADRDAIIESLITGEGVLGRRFATLLASWDQKTDSDWNGAKTTDPATNARRSAIYDALGLTEATRARCTQRHPVILAEPPVVIAESNTEWYTAARRKPAFYWEHYCETLRRQGWSEQSVLQLDSATNSVVARLADPTAEAQWQSKGLVVGYVQSGKTANFTGVIARAADAGYRLIIILGGTLNLLRAQTQRRIDKELIGREQLGDDYRDDAEWEEFVSYGSPPSMLGAYDWRRLTGPIDDYQRLKYGLSSLEFERVDASKPLYHPDNLFRQAARLVVIKKLPDVLGRLVNDLRALRTQLTNVPTLIIDDESDQASINTRRNDDETSSEERDRTATNKRIVELLQILPRAQYIGYTATPFANVLIDPTDEADLFPKDFIVSLPRPMHYMGVSDFFDGVDEDLEGLQSKERAFLRDVVDEDSDGTGLRRAIDSFVLTGAIKLYRQSLRSDLKFKHHTMLVHRSHKRSEHDEDALVVRRLFLGGDYGGDGLDRLEKLWRDDFLPVSQAQEPGLEMPERFDDLLRHIGDCLGRIGREDSSVLVVNSDSEDLPDFDKRPQWKILVGGTKLSRGYTIEGLTVSYYRRRVGQADTLMQMGRWFGFRRGYRDLVRLFLGTDEAGPRDTTVNLRDQFKRLCVIEEEFREILAAYSRDGGQRLVPRQVPPLVPAEIQGLAPTARNKMFNAVLKGINLGGRNSNPTEAPVAKSDRSYNAKLAKALLVATRAGAKLTVGFEDRSVWPVWLAEVDPAEVRTFLQRYRWAKGVSPSPIHHVLSYLEGAAGDPAIARWLVLAPLSDKKGELFDAGALEIPVRKRTRVNEGRYGVYTEPKHVQVAQHLAGHDPSPRAAKSARGTQPTPELVRNTKPATAVLLFYAVRAEHEKDGDPSIGFALYFPQNSQKNRLFWSVRDQAQPEAVVVPVPADDAS